MRRSIRSLGLVLLLVVAGAACRHGSVVGSKAADQSWNGAMKVRVVNHSWLDVTVYVVQGTRRDRVGTATATTTTEFQVALRRLSSGGEYRLLGDPVGARTSVRSEPLYARDGDVVIWTLEDDLSRSTVEVR